MENKKVQNILEVLVEGFDFDIDRINYKEVSNYIEKLERENFGLRQQVTNLKEKDQKRWL